MLWLYYFHLNNSESLHDRSPTVSQLTKPTPQPAPVQAIKNKTSIFHLKKDTKRPRQTTESTTKRNKGGRRNQSRSQPSQERSPNRSRNESNRGPGDEGKTPVGLGILRENCLSWCGGGLKCRASPALLVSCCRVVCVKSKQQPSQRARRSPPPKGEWWPAEEASNSAPRNSRD